MGEHPPRAAASQEVEKRIDDLVHRVGTVSAAGFGRGNQRFDAFPLGVGQVTGIAFAFHRKQVVGFDSDPI